jgi:hypothetical protein
MAHQDGMHVTKKIPRALILEDKDIQESVTGGTSSKHRKGPSVKATVPQQDKRSLPEFSIMTFHRDP